MEKVLHRTNNMWCNHHGKVVISSAEHHVRLAVNDSQKHQILTDQDLLGTSRMSIVGCTQANTGGHKRCTKIVSITRGLSTDLLLANEIPILANLVAVTNGVPAGVVKYNELHDVLESNEARRTEAYDDGRGNITIGVGTVLKDKDGNEFRSKIDGMGLDFDKLLDGSASIDDEQIDTLRDRGIASFTSEVRRNVSGFDTIDSTRQNTLIEMAYNRGLGAFLGTSSKMKTVDADSMKSFQSAVAGKDWETAATTLETNTSYRNFIGDRIDRFAKLIRGELAYGEPAP